MCRCMDRYEADMTTLREFASTNSLHETKTFLLREHIEYNDLYHALWDAVRYGYEDMVDLLLLDQRILAIAADKENGCLLKAVEYGHNAIVKRLLAIPSVKNNIGTQRNSALVMAQLKCDKELVEMLTK